MTVAEGCASVVRGSREVEGVAEKAAGASWMLVSAHLSGRDILTAAVEFGHLDGLEGLLISLREIEGA